MGKSVHGHYSKELEKEIKRIIDEANQRGQDLNWVEATEIAAIRSSSVIWNENKFKKELARARGVII